MEDQSKKRKNENNDYITLDITNSSIDSSNENCSQKSDNFNNNNNNHNSYNYNHNNNNGNNYSSRNKRINSNTTDDLYFKILVPSYAAGGVIGKGGEKIAKMQRELNIRIKMSKNNDYFPTTNERVCLMQGNIDSIIKANDFIMEKFSEKPDTKTFEEDRVNQIKVIIHHNMAGSLIGKGGSHIKQIKEESGAYVQITPKQNDFSERILLIEGDKEKRNKALKIILKEFTEDSHYDYPNITNLSYADSPTNSSSSSSSANLNTSLNTDSTKGLLLQPGSNTLLLGLNRLNELITQNNTNNLIQLSGLNNLAHLITNCGGIAQLNSDNLTTALRNSNYGFTAVNEIIDAISVLISYNLIVKPNNTNNSLSNSSNTVNGTQGNGLLGTPPSLMNIPTSSLLNSTNNLASNTQQTNNNTNLLATLLSGVNNNSQNQNNLGSLLQLLSNLPKQ